MVHTRFTHIVTIVILITAFLPNRLKGQETNDYSSSWNQPSVIIQHMATISILVWSPPMIGILL